MNLPAELRQYILPVAPIFNKSQADKLGEGGQATVYKGAYQGKSVAIKVINPDVESMKDAANEVILTKRVAHPNIINIIGVYLSPQGMFIVMELASDSLKGIIDKRRGPLTPMEIVTFGKQIADALNYCTTQNPREPICYRDLKMENVLIVNGQAKLADFGLAYTRTNAEVMGPDDDVEGNGVAGTTHWQGPEISNVVCKSNADTEELGAENIGHRGEFSELYAFGLLLWSMATGKYPFMDKHPGQIMSLLLQGERPEIPSGVHPTLAHLIRSCWRQNYKLRPRFSKVAAILTMCGAGNLGAVSKEILNQLVPLRYSPLKDMYPGELYEYLTEQGVPQSIAAKLRSQQMNGDYFTACDAREFIEAFELSEAEARHLVSLQKPHMRPTANIGPFLNAPVTAPVNAPAATTRPFINSPILAPVFAPASILQASLPPELREYALKEVPSFQQNDADLLGKGGQGAVYKGTYQGKSVAIKKVLQKFTTEAKAEVLLMRKLGHDHIVKIEGIFSDENMLCIVMERASMSLTQYIKRKSSLSGDEIIILGFQLASALQYCLDADPGHPIHHRDLKTDNVLIFEVGSGNIAKLTDFGFAVERTKTFESSKAGNTHFFAEDNAGTERWQGPEVFLQSARSRYAEDNSTESNGFRGELSDVYSYGMVLWSMASGAQPFTDTHCVRDAVPRGRRPEIPFSAHKSVKHLIRTCWSQNYRLRPKFIQILRALKTLQSAARGETLKEEIDNIIPIKYSEFEDMYNGELYEYLTEHGISREEAWKLSNNQINGLAFLALDEDKLVKKYHIIAPVAKAMLGLKPVKLNASSSGEESSYVSTRQKLVSSTSANRPIPPKPIAKMDNEELIAYLTRQNGIIDSFIDGLRVDEVNGEGFLRMLDSEMLALPPYNLKGLQLRGTLKLIEELKLH